jgi:hypothetical protein
MEKQALLYLQQALDKATQKGAFSLSEAANIVNALEELNKFINPDKSEDHGKEEN